MDLRIFTFSELLRKHRDIMLKVRFLEGERDKLNANIIKELETRALFELNDPKNFKDIVAKLYNDATTGGNDANRETR